MNLPEKVPFSVKAYYGLGQLSVGSFGTMSRLCLFFFYSQVLGISPALVGFATAIATVFDAITDPIIGSISDNFKSKYGRRLPFLFAGTLPTSISIFLLFNPLVTGDAALFYWLVFFSCLTNFLSTLFVIPYFAVGAEITENYDERASVVAFRNFFYFFGQAFVMYLAYGYFFLPSEEFPNGQLNPAVYGPFSVVVAMLFLVTSVISIFGFKNHIPNNYRGNLESLSFSKIFLTIFRDIFEALSNYSFRMLFFGNVFLTISAGISFTLELYALTFFWGLSGELSLLLVGLAFYPGAFLGVFLSNYLIQAFEKRNVMVWGIILWILFIVVPIILSMNGLFPASGTATLIVLLIISKIIQGLVIIPPDVAFNAAMADTADQQELVNSKRQEGIFFASAYFSIKASYGIGAAIAGVALTLIGWPTGSEAEITDLNIYNLGIILGPVVAVFGLIGGFIYSKYDLTREKHEQIRSQLKEKRG